MNLLYLLPRVIRRFLPAPLVSLLLRNSFIIHPGSEVSNPEKSTRFYLEALDAKGTHVHSKRVLILGYGGFFGVACMLLDANAEHVVLVENSVEPNDQLNKSIYPEFKQYLRQSGNRIIPNPKFITVYDGDIRELSAKGEIDPVDFVFSISVFEHLEDVEGVTRALIGLTKPEGLHLNFVDLRDHFFSYPFEFLTFSERVWKRWLNPGCNLNRYRLLDYKRVFERHFLDVDIVIRRREEEVFLKAKPRIRPEFLTGDTKIDAGTLIRITASNLIKK